MRSKVWISVLIIITALMLSACFPFNLLFEEKEYPMYERELNDEDGIRVTTDEAVYTLLPLQKWEGQDSGEIFAYAGSKDYTLYLAEDDPNRYFIYIYDPEYCPVGNTSPIMLHRVDIPVPQPSVDTVDELYWSEYDYNGDETLHRGIYIDDKQIIKELFDVWEDEERARVSDTDKLSGYSYTISCLSKSFPDLSYKLEIENYNGTLVCGNWHEWYVEIPIELVEKLAGHSIDVEELTK